MPRRGSLTNLRALPQHLSLQDEALSFVKKLEFNAFPLRSKRPTLKPGEVEVRVEAIGLNFRDVLNVPLPPFNMGKYAFFCLFVVSFGFCEALQETNPYVFFLDIFLLDKFQGISKLFDL